MSTKVIVGDDATSAVELGEGPFRKQPSPDVKKSDYAVLVWQNLVVSVGPKVLLKNLSGSVNGGFWAVMGPSGSGKSTLLNTLAMRLDVVTKVEGELRLNGRNYRHTHLKNMAGYVMQDDLLNGNLTVEETITYAAKLRLPASMGDDERKNRVDQVIDQMGLNHTRNVIIGSPLRKGISGGERRRVCVALELLTQPVLLFLDEPTSGLDSVTALELCRTLKELTSSGVCTVVCTIHQPQSKIFFLFDNLILLKGGSIIFHGPITDSIEYFSKAGFPVPAYTNPADHFMDVIAPTRADIENKDNSVEERLIPESQKEPIDLDFGSEKPLILHRDSVPWIKQFIILFQRSAKEHLRSYGALFASLFQALFMAILIGTVFLQIGDNQNGTVRRQPVLFFITINQGVFGALIVINSFPAERALCLRERAAGSYHASAYFLAKTTAETLIQLPFPIIFSCIVYWLVGLQNDANKFFVFMVIVTLCSLAATSLALMVSTICRTTNMSVTVLPIALEISRLFGAFFLAPINMSKHFVWLDALSYVKYSYVALSLNELTGLKLVCLQNQLKNGVCPITSGEQTIASLGFDQFTLGGCIGALILYICIARFFAYLGLRFIKW